MLPPLRRRGWKWANCEENTNIASTDVLCALAADLGLDGDELRQHLDAGTYRERVLQEYEESRSIGVTAVPTFVADRYAIVGAHPYSSFEKLMETVGQEPRQKDD